MIKDLIAYSSSLAISQLFMLKMQKWADVAENSTLIFKSFKLLLAQFGFLLAMCSRRATGTDDGIRPLKMAPDEWNLGWVYHMSLDFYYAVWTQARAYDTIRTISDDFWHQEKYVTQAQKSAGKFFWTGFQSFVYYDSMSVLPRSNVCRKMTTFFPFLLLCPWTWDFHLDKDCRLNADERTYTQHE